MDKFLNLGITWGLRTYCVVSLATICFAASLVGTAFADPRIVWEVGNRYRAFDYKAGRPQSPQKSAKQFELYRQEISEKSEEALSHWFKRIIENGRSPYIADPGPWNESDGKYHKDFVHLPKLLLVKARIVADEDRMNELAQKPCVWRINKTETSGPCNVPFIIPDFDSAGAKITVLQDGVEVVSEDIKPELKIILGLGDSYAAGEGNPDSPTKWQRTDGRTWPPLNDTAASGQISRTAQKGLRKFGQCAKW